MSRLFNLLFILIIISGCSLNKNSKFWTATQEIKIEKNFKRILKTEASLGQELNPNLGIKFNSQPEKISYLKYQTNNFGRLNFDGNLKKISRYKFQKIKKFNEYEPDISFNKKNLIFFDNKGAILKFNDASKLIWKKNYYTKNEKKLNPILQFASNDKYLVVADNIARYFMLDLKTGNLIWTKSNLAPFNSQIKIYKDMFFIVDFSNTLRCFSLKDGSELWKISTDNSLIRSKKKLSIAIYEDTLYFNNSLGDITAVSISNKEFLWQLPTQSSLIYEAAFSLETSDIIVDKESLYLSNNKNQFFSIDIKSGSFNWKNKINSSLKSTLIGDYLISVSLEGYLIITEKRSGNIIRVTDVFQNFKMKKRVNIKPTGFVVGLKKIYLSTSNGRLLIIDIASGKTISILKIDNEKISKPFIQNKNLFLIKDNAIIRLN